MSVRNYYNVQVFNVYQMVPPQQRSGQHYQPRQINNSQLQPHIHQPQIIQASISSSMSLPSTNGLVPNVSLEKDPNYCDIHSFKLIKRGKGIDKNEYYYITHAANDAYQAREDPLSKGTIKRIKKALGGEWMVFSGVKGLKGYDFTLSIVTGNDFLSFTIGDFDFQVCRLTD